MAGDRTPPTARLEQAIAAARADEPTLERLAQVRERIAQQSAGAQDASGGAAGPASAPLVKAATALGVLGLIVAGASWWAGTTQPSSAPALAPAPPRAPVHAVAEPVRAPVAKPPVEPPVALTRKLRQPQAASPDPAATTAADSRAGALEPARKPAPVRAPSEATTRPPAIQAEPAAQKPQPQPAQQDDSELALLRAARAALAADPAGALRLTDRHAQRFPAGVLREEREVIAIEALARAGRQADARARADRFAASFPSSVHGERVTRAVGQP